MQFYLKNKNCIWHEWCLSHLRIIFWVVFLLVLHKFLNILKILHLAYTTPYFIPVSDQSLISQSANLIPSTDISSNSNMVLNADQFSSNLFFEGCSTKALHDQLNTDDLSLKESKKVCFVFELSNIFTNNNYYIVLFFI